MWPQQEGFLPVFSFVSLTYRHKYSISHDEQKAKKLKGLENICKEKKRKEDESKKEKEFRIKQENYSLLICGS